MFSKLFLALAAAATLSIVAGCQSSSCCSADASCCAKAKAEGKTCTKPCCVEAAKTGAVCKKCNPA